MEGNGAGGVYAAEKIIQKRIRKVRLSAFFFTFDCLLIFAKILFALLLLLLLRTFL